ncbi:MAG TPA: ATPase [Ruminococcaceae bacterium]|nr:ATPase [Oscillospiraceae bacterium]
MQFYLQEAESVFRQVKSTVDGLTTAEAEKRLAANGKNKLDEAKKDSLIKRFFAQMLDPMVIILIVAAVISAVLAVVEGAKGGGSASIGDFADVIIIMAVVIINAALGVYQDSKAEAAIQALQEMSASTSKVLRDGKITHVKSEDIVVGDVILLEAGDAVPADCRLFECASIKAEEAALTGESVPVGKRIDALNGGEKGEVALGDRKNMVYSGSSIAYGHGKAVVVATGMQTEMGKIADAITKAEEGLTPLQIKLAQLSKILTFLVVGICVFIFGFDIVRELVAGEGFSGVADFFTKALDSFMVAVSLAVAAIPEGLVAVVTIVLSLGVTSMSKRRAIIRKLTAVETLGCAQVICSDKTGTLTQNKMTVVDYYGDDQTLLAKGMALCTDAEINADGSETTGEPTECALVNYAFSLGMSKTDLSAVAPRVAEAPFDSMRKMMSTVHDENGTVVQYTKGAPDEILKKCIGVLKDGKIVPITDELKKEILTANKTMADKALRVLALSFKKYETVPADASPAALENELVFVGLEGMIDPCRPEVKDAIAECRSAGIRPIMITGDHKDTAVAIAIELGIIKDASEAITGAELNGISDEDFEEKVKLYSVYARVQPEHKVRIVNAWRKVGMVTAMTGDGVNDAPSIKSADIGIGMGITGTDVTKNVADMVLADDNFATIVNAVEEGRKIYDNIRKAIHFLLSSNLSEVLTVFAASILGFTILKPTHLLFINLVTDCFPALALGMEKGESNLMKRAPRKSTDGVFSGGIGFDLTYQGVLVTIFTLAAYFIGAKLLGKTEGDGMTMAFLTMSMCEIFHSFNMRSQRQSVLRMGIKEKSHNKFLYLAMLASLLLTTAIIEVPLFANAFDFTEIGFVEYAVALGLAFAIIPIVEIVKLIQRNTTMKK